MQPDQTILATDPGDGPFRLVAARGDDGAFAIAYSPLGQNVSIHLDKLKGAKVKARWYDPRDGAWRDIGAFAATGTHEFIPPLRGEQDDWVIVLDGSQ